MTRELRGPAGLGQLVEAGVLDAELASLVWLLVEARTPVLVAGTGAAGRDATRERVRDALLGVLPASVTARRLAGPDERFAWMPEAAALGWRDPGAPDASPSDAAMARPDWTVLVADLDPGCSRPTWGEHARVAIRALSLGYGMLGLAPGGRLEAVLGRLAGPPVSALDDELTRLGIVLILGRGGDADGDAGEDADDEGGRRVVAAHYLRPVARDAEGHVQRRSPAVLATWDASRGRFEHFAWGILDELGGRTGMTPVELEREQARRMEQLRGSAPHRTA